MKTEQEIISEFKAELKALLTKYDANIIIEDAATGWDQHDPYFEITLNGYSQIFDIKKTTIYPEIL